MAQPPSVLDLLDAPGLVDGGVDPDTGCSVVRGLAPVEAVERVLRRLNLEIMRYGLDAEQIRCWNTGTYFPHLRWEPEVLALRATLDHLPLLHLRPGEQWADTQLVLRFPDEATDWPLEPHVDRLPEWAESRAYRVIAGVALTRSHRYDGCLAVWPGSHRGLDSHPHLVELDVGDVIFMHGALRHSGTLNHGGAIRYAAYFRLLTAAGDLGTPSPP